MIQIYIYPHSLSIEFIGWEGKGMHNTISHIGQIFIVFIWVFFTTPFCPFTLFSMLNYYLFRLWRLTGFPWRNRDSAWMNKNKNEKSGINIKLMQWHLLQRTENHLFLFYALILRIFVLLYTLSEFTIYSSIIRVFLLLLFIRLNPSVCVFVCVYALVLLYVLHFW